MRLANAKNALDATIDEVKQRLGKAKEVSLFEKAFLCHICMAGRGFFL